MSDAGGERYPRRSERTRPVFPMDRMQPRVRLWMHGPKWRRHFGVLELPVPSESAGYHRPGKRLLFVDLEPDVRELVCLNLELRPGVYAQWSDPMEALGWA